MISIYFRSSAHKKWLPQVYVCITASVESNLRSGWPTPCAERWYKTAWETAAIWTRSAMLSKSTTYDPETTQATDLVIRRVILWLTSSPTSMGRQELQSTGASYVGATIDS